MQIWDTAGQERFHKSLGQAFYRGAEACILVFDITNRDSFDKIPVWKTEFFEKLMPADESKIPVVILGNKCDLENDRQVPKDDIDAYMNSNPSFLYYETSALVGTNVEDCF